MKKVNKSSKNSTICRSLESEGGLKLKIGNDVLKFRKRKSKTTKKSYVYQGQYKRLLSEIERIKTVEQVSLVEKVIHIAYSKGKITNAQYNLLSSKLNERASKVGEKEKTIKLGPLGEFGVKSKGKVT